MTVRPCEIDHPRLGSGERADIGGAADRDDLAVAHGERLGRRGGRIERHDLAVEQHGIGVLGMRGHAECRRGHGESGERCDDGFHGGSFRLPVFQRD